VEDRPASSPRIGSYLAWLILGAAVLGAMVLGAIVIYGVGRTGPTTETNSVPTSARRADAVPARTDPANAQGQPSPQGATGPINTTSGGAPASSPQGETPPGMQAAPKGSSEKIVAPAK
jgi:hypothetical protein